jgi:hypothetical protein
VFSRSSGTQPRLLGMRLRPPWPESCRVAHSLMKVRARGCLFRRRIANRHRRRLRRRYVRPVVVVIVVSRRVVAGRLARLLGVHTVRRGHPHHRATSVPRFRWLSSVPGRYQRRAAVTPRRRAPEDGTGHWRSAAWPMARDVPLAGHRWTVWSSESAKASGRICTGVGRRVRAAHSRSSCAGHRSVRRRGDRRSSPSGTPAAAAMRITPTCRPRAFGEPPSSRSRSEGIRLSIASSPRLARCARTPCERMSWCGEGEKRVERAHDLAVYL